MANETKEFSNQISEQEDRYLEAEVARRKAELQPSKLHTMPIVAYIEQDGRLIPVYREEQ